ncbi:MFS transporter [Aliidongia dinghuensis]|uniref:MFS transporter n=1 Tax=Aliidongia dinghuensis TaxID=1867774 RepID=A0A8J2YRF3_9PROT|nr:MFS transporter [Aliidongia dinghuensis]GGF09241.1 MFS transporter [Aliidongia dinghuensis]
MFVLKPLARRPIALLWSGQVLAATGSEFYMVAVVWIAADLIGREAGYVSAVQAGVLLFGSLFSGVLTDRWRHGATMIAADLARAVLVLVLSVAGLLHMMSLPLLILVAGAVALGTSAFDPALQATLPAIAPDPVLRHATNGLFDATKRMARILGPSLIALVNGFVPKTQFFTLTAITFLLSALAVRAVNRGLGEAPQRRSVTGTAAVIDSLLGGLRAVRGHGLVIYGLVGNMIGNLTWAMGVLLGMVLYLRATSTDPLTDYSLMMTAYGIGNLGTNLILASRRPGRPQVQLVIAKFIFGTGVFLLPLMPNRAMLMLVAGFAAINGPFENLAILHLIQSRFPPHRLAQVYRLQMCSVFAGLFLAYTIAPTLYGWFGLAPVIMAAGALTFATGLVGLVLVVRRRAVRVPA